MQHQANCDKERTMRRGLFLAVLTGMTCGFPRAAHAYLDPGSGSMFLQLVLGGMAGLAVLLKLYWQRFLRVFGVDQTKDPKSEDAQASERE